ncbi:hypothetical protein Btru_007070 [Bulinus truncatus]|nr:hypothetical protein Btru_007070 [Bulinus truncatus]
MDAGPLLEKYFKPLLDFLKNEVGNDYGASPTISDVDRAEEFLRRYNTEAEKWRHAQAEAEFDYESNLTDENKNKKIKAELDLAKFELEKQKEAWQYNITGMPDNIKRQFKFIRDIGQSAQSNQTKIRQLEDAKLEMQSIYGKAKVCLKSGQCLSLEPELTQLMAESRDYDELLAAWKGWRDVTGPKMKKNYTEYTELYNEAIRLSCFKDGGEYWRSWYDSATFQEDIAQLYSQIQPLYEQLHAYVRRKLKGIYPKDKFPASGHIPAHILGDMWAQHWTEIVNDTAPYPDKPTADVTEDMQKQKYNASLIFHKAEEFFASLGLPHMVPVFWEKSVMVKPNGTEMVCHATAYDLQNRSDFRIKMCTDITQKDLVTVHHEMGHIEYYMQYKDQPIIFREGANNGFHEAIGDVMALSVQTPEHLHKMGLLREIPTDNETDINFLYKMALEKVAFLPFGYLIDQWRWSVFSGQTQPDSYTQDWWKLRCRLQGLHPPVERSSHDFDPGAKYHVPAAIPYIRYFVSYVIQFQFHKAACQAAGHKGPLHRCDIYNSTKAGKLIGLEENDIGGNILAGLIAKLKSPGLVGDNLSGTQELK